MTSILGISAFYHDSAAALAVDGRVVAAAQEERFSRKRHDPGFPRNAASFCLAEAGMGPRDLDAVAFYDKPLLKFERLLETYLAFAPRGLRSFLKAMPPWLGMKLHAPREIDAGLGGEFKGPIYFALHHESHAASAFFPSPFEEAAIITVDGVGEWTTTSFGVGRGNSIRLLKEIRFPHSLGLLYSAFAYYAGFKVNSGEYKLMGLAPYGRPKYADLILEKIIDLRDDGSFRLDQSYFDYCHGLVMTSTKFHRLFKGPPRTPESDLTEKDMDIAASIQKVAEEAMLRIARHVHRETGMRNLCLAGGVALNCVANGRILREGPFREVWIQPAAGDAGGALGAALLAWHHVMGKPRTPARPDGQAGSLLGPACDGRIAAEYLDHAGAKYRKFDSDADLEAEVAGLLAAGKIVGLCCGRMEFGPRALGARSMLADARDPGMRDRLNRDVKFRESFRPFAPACLAERAADYFDLDRPSPYMLLTAAVRESRRKPLTPEQAALSGLDRLKAARSDVPAVTHVDYSARVQTVDASLSPVLYRIIKAFEGLTGCGLVVNTSFNVRGEPIVRTHEDAYRCFMRTGMDALVLDRLLCLKERQPRIAGGHEIGKPSGPD